MKKEKEYKKNNLFITALTLLACFLALELLLRSYNLYMVFPDVDIISHVLAGVTLYAVIYWILTQTKTERKKTTTLSFTFVLAIVWEVLEQLEDRIITNAPYMIDYLIWDGVVDITTTTLGGVIGMGILKLLKITN